MIKSTVNDITNDRISTGIKKTSDAYRSNWDAIFNKDGFEFINEGLEEMSKVDQELGLYNKPKQTVFVVVKEDFADGITQTFVDSLWHDWKDAAQRVHELNVLFQQDEFLTEHAHCFEKEIQ